MTTKCIIHTETGLCVNIIDDPEDSYTAPEGYSIAPDNTGTFYWYWDGDNWINPYENYLNGYLGYPIAETPDITDESNSVATTFYVRQKIQDYIENEWLPTATISGGSFSDAAVVASYDAGSLDGTGGNLTGDLTSPDFSNSGGNLSGDINGGTF